MRLLLAVLILLAAGCESRQPYNFLECEGMMRRIEHGADTAHDYEQEVKKHCPHLVELVRGVEK